MKSIINCRFDGNTAAADETIRFITDKDIAADKRLAIPELNSGFVINELCQGENLLNPVQTKNGVKTVYSGDGCVPLLFKAELAKEGNYLVKAEITAEEDTEGLLFAGRRHLAVRHRFKAGEHFTQICAVNICPIIPRTFQEAMEDTTLDIALVGKGLNLVGVEISEFDGPVIYIAGDSTVTDQSAAYPYDPALSYSGWGQMLSTYLGTEYAVSNHAHSGLTTESMRSEGHFAILYDRIKKGDICLLQFGHNDQKLDSLKAFEGYTDNLMRYIDEIRAKEAVPVIISPLARNTWKSDGTYNDLLEEYARACEAAAKAKGVPYVDLHAMSMDFVTKNGRETARRWYYPSDYTHSNDYGAYLFAGFVYEGLIKAGVIPDAADKEESAAKLCCGVQPESPTAAEERNTRQQDAWIPPVEVPVIRLPEKAKKDGDTAGCSGDAAQIKKNGAAGAQEAGKSLKAIAAETERPEDLITRAEAFEEVIKTAKFFPTNVYNDMFDDIVGHETYAGSIECAYQNGIIPDSLIEKTDGKAMIHPSKPILLGEFLEILRLGYACRRPEENIIDSLDTCGIASGDTLTRAQAAYICSQVKV